MRTKRFCSSLLELPESLRLWFKESPGCILLEQERVCIEELLAGLFGYYLVQVGCLGLKGEPLQASKIRSQVLVAPDRVENACSMFMRGSPEKLPIATDSIDVVLLPHTLDFSPDPHQVLREAERVLIPEGRLIILGFNPVSLWGLRRLFRYRHGKVPWCGQFLSQRRVFDWLQLVGFDLEVTRPLMFRPPLKSRGLMERLVWWERIGEKYWLPFSGVYVVQAVKRVSRLTPVEPAWKIRAGVLSGRLAEPTTRNPS